MKLTKILLPTDFSESAERALHQAVALAQMTKAELHIFHAVLLHAEDPQHLQTVLKGYTEHIDEQARETLERTSGEIGKRGLNVSISTARSVSPFEAIMEAVGRIRPELIVMGTHGRTGVGRLLLGSVTEKVLRHAPTHVLTVQKDSPVVGDSLEPKRILVAIDFTDFSRRALEVATSLLSEKDSLTLVHVVASPIHPSFYAGGITDLFEVDPELPSRIKNSLEEWLGDRPGEIIVTEGSAADEILAAAKKTQAELIVIGRRGLSAAEHILMGSVSERIVRTSKVPVLTVK